MADPLVFNQQVRIFWNTEPTGALATLRDPLRGTALEVDDVAVLDLCERTSAPRTRAELVAELADTGAPADEREQLIASLVEHRVLVPPDENRWTKWDQYNWGEAAVFHYLSRNQVFLDEASRELSSPVRTATLRRYLDESGPPELFTRRDVAYRPLPPPTEVEHVDFYEVLMDRRTIRKYNGKPTDAGVLSSVLHEATARARALRLEIERGYRSDPELLLKSWGSAFEVYVVAHRVEGVAQGIYHYDMRDHGLGLIRAGDFEDQVYNGIWGQPMALKTCFTIFLVACFERYMWRYRYDRGLRNLLTNMGELAQIFILAGIARGLGNSMTPASRDSFLDDLLGLEPAREQTMYFLGFGHYR
jgi:SagB-type dehydrogenase family enzyme